MTTPLPAPTGQPTSPAHIIPSQGRPAQGGMVTPTTTPTYTHRTWINEVADDLTDLAAVWGALRELNLALDNAGAGKTQLALIARSAAEAEALIKRHLKFVEKVDDLYKPVYDAIKRVGLDEVALDKRYHDRDR